MDDGGKKPAIKTGQLKSYATFLIWMLLLLIAVNAVVYLQDFYAGLIMSFGLFAYLVIILVYYFTKRRKAMQNLVDFVTAYECLQNHLMQQFDFPYFLLDKESRFLWGNKEFGKLHEEIPKMKRRPITELFPELTAAKMPRGGDEANFYMQYGEQYFRVNIRTVCDKEELSIFSFPDIQAYDMQHLYAVSLFDETKLREYMHKYEEETMVSAMLYLDNYEEALESVEEVSRSILTALIDRKINQYFGSYDCLVRKFERDKYLIVMQTKSMRAMGESKFGILEEIKGITTDNEISVTISIGIGSNQGSYAKNLEAAKICIDLALGRGGDQVVVKDADSIQYFGGKSQGVEKSTRVKARVKAHALHEFMAVSEQVIVMGHRLIDIDAFGAAIGIFRAAHTLNKRVHIVVDTVSPPLRPFVNLFKDNGAYDDKLIVSCEEAKSLINEKTLLVVVDTSRPGYTGCEELLSRTKNIVVLDHHRQSSDVIRNSMLSYIEPYASSACEMVTEILQYFSQNVKLKTAEADVLYAGMVVDTDNFVQKTGVRTFEAAAYLRRSGADVTRVRKMFRENMADYVAKSDAIRNVQIFHDNFAISVCRAEGLEQPTIVGAQAANSVLNIIGVRASFVLTDYKGTIYISARSIDEINVQLIMERLGGGGHMNIAGAQMQGVSVEDAIEKLKQVIEEMQNGGEI